MIRRGTGILYFAVQCLCVGTMAIGAVGIQGGGTYPSIQSAVDASVNGDTILISQDTFYESVVVSNKNLTLEGGYNSNLTTRTGLSTLVSGSSTVRPFWFIDSTSHVDRVDMASGLGDIWGGGGALLHRSWVEFQDSDFHNNEAPWGGGILVGTFSYALLTGDSDIFNNTATSPLGGFGGGAYVDGRMDIVDNDARVSGNTAVDGKGGGIWVETGYLRLFQGDVWHNVATNGLLNPASLGGGIGAIGSFIEIGDGVEFLANSADLGGGMGILGSTGQLGRARIDDLAFYGNRADQGGGFYASNSVVHSQGLRFNNNHALLFGGGACLVQSSIDSDTNLIVFSENSAESSGGGMFLEDSVADLQCAVFGESATLGNRCGSYGGGMMAYASSVIMAGAQFMGNSATGEVMYSIGCGGAIAALGNFASPSSVILTNGPGSFGSYTNTVFFENSAATNHGRGGAVYLDNLSSMDGWNSLMYSNSAYDGGAVYATAMSFVTLAASRLEGNTALDSGGALFSDGLQAGFGHSSFERNTARVGGAFFLSNCFAEVGSCRFIENEASVMGGGIYSRDSGALVVAGMERQPYVPPAGWPSLFQGNTSDWGAAIHVYNTAAIVDRSAIIGNRSDTGHGSGFLAEQCDSVDLHSSLFADNSSSHPIDISNCHTAHIDLCTIASNGSVGIALSYAHLTMSNSILRASTSLFSMNSTADVFYCNIEGGHPGGGNFDADPMFFPNFHLEPTSPCVDAGFSTTGGTWDIDAEERVGTIDVGFDEVLDTDDDGLPDVVETGTGVWGGDSNTGSDPLDPDSDGDHVSDGDEWHADTDPNDPGDLLRLTRIWREPSGDISVEWEGGTRSHRYVEWCDSLTTGTWAWALHEVPPTLATNSMSSGGEPKEFVRIRAHR